MFCRYPFKTVMMAALISLLPAAAHARTCSLRVGANDGYVRHSIKCSDIETQKEIQPLEDLLRRQKRFLVNVLAAMEDLGYATTNVTKYNGWGEATVYFRYGGSAVGGKLGRYQICVIKIDANNGYQKDSFNCSDSELREQVQPTNKILLATGRNSLAAIDRLENEGYVNIATTAFDGWGTQCAYFKKLLRATIR